MPTSPRSGARLDERATGAARPPAQAEPPASALDPAAVRAALHARGDAVRRRELDRLFDTLEARGSLTARQRATIATLASALVAGALDAPDTVLADPAAHDPETVRAVATLFAPEQ